MSDLLQTAERTIYRERKRSEMVRFNVRRHVS